MPHHTHTFHSTSIVSSAQRHLERQSYYTYDECRSYSRRYERVYGLAICLTVLRPIAIGAKFPVSEAHPTRYHDCHQADTLQ